MLMYTWDAITRGPVRRSGVHCDRAAALEAAAAELAGADVTAVRVDQVHAPLTVASGYQPTGRSWTGRRTGGRVAWTGSRDVTRDGITRDAPPGHRIEIIEGSAYRTGKGNCTGTPAILANSWHHPVTAICAACSGVVARESIDGEWAHTGRQAGQDPAVAVPRTPATAGPAGDSSPGESPAGGEG